MGQARDEQGCKALLEPKWHGAHDLLVRLLGKCTCEAGEAHVVELYRPAEAREHPPHVSLTS